MAKAKISVIFGKSTPIDMIDREIPPILTGKHLTFNVKGICLKSYKKAKKSRRCSDGKTSST